MSNGKALILYCHPEPKAFNGKIRDTTVEYLKDKNFEVKVVDLGETKFNAVLGKHDFTNLKKPDHLDYQGEQRHAAEGGLTFSDDIKEQHELLKWCDHLILIFPFYWFNVPGCLKGWFDRVLAWHLHYGGDCKVGGKMFYSCTTGGLPEWYKKDALWDAPVELYLKNIWATAKLLKMELLNPFIAHGINFKKDEEKDTVLEDYKKHLGLVIKV